MTDIFSWWNGAALPPTAVPVALVCAMCGAAVLALFTRWIGLATLLINAVVLFIGAYAANVLSADLNLPLERYYVRPIMMSFLGMSISSLVVLALLSRGRHSQ